MIKEGYISQRLYWLYTVKNGVLQYTFFGASATLAVVHPIGCNGTPQNSVPIYPSNTPV